MRALQIMTDQIRTKVMLSNKIGDISNASSRVLQQRLIEITHSMLS
ncbi:Uncharacterised protein [Mycobacteroides abscessus subsp. abscessus]|nr:Uncharacterised protein [Mycobacteroides abscessus subsp. abscessus]